MRKERPAEPSLTGLDGLTTRTMDAANLRMARARPAYTSPLQICRICCNMHDAVAMPSLRSELIANHYKVMTLVMRTSPQPIFSMSAGSQPNWSQ